MKQSRQSAKFAYQGLKELVKFGKFAETEGAQATSTLIAIVAEEHVAPSRSNLSFSFEVSDDDDNDNDDDDDDVDDDDDDDDSDDNDDVNFLLFFPPKEPVNEVVITPAETESSTARKPPQTVPVTVESPSESDKDEPNASQMPKKRRRRDLRPGVLIAKPVKLPTLNVELAQVIQDVQTPTVEPAQVHEDVQALIVKPA
ncbi:unnamed protein product [Lactuca virosa]|uniref:Uncharacterized protein n=1 Tax=Lactuca virosa TaxID=75947 RepID=A0AAU9LQ39_9ASTR|nr:unnamed protein product [Lactuca virosa]